MEKFWENQEWLDKAKEEDYSLYEKICDGKKIEMDWEAFSIIIDDSRTPLTLEQTKKK